MCSSDLIGKLSGCALAGGSAFLASLFNSTFLILLPVILVHIFSSWYNKTAKNTRLKRVLVVIEVVFSILTMLGYFIVSNAVFALLPGVGKKKEMAMPMLAALYAYFALYSYYTAYIIYSYLDQDTAEDDDSSDAIRYNQLKMLRRELMQI
ncbi:uncharacterized protein NEMAJ01_1084 [Nematocida major]|uniref:uncharacterized protein n=1 Tax=Nematocida major TaxID=1912982 RepID=UPI002008E12F|nr:uncharacterized protein NEMAJ01_1084 [Nematocida major]KAH9386188.1 hypothetical protein NEMAJ01_1084 [Nematocida major]